MKDAICPTCLKKANKEVHEWLSDTYPGEELVVPAVCNHDERGVAYRFRYDRTPNLIAVREGPLL
jgi:hypothetical protein